MAVETYDLRQTGAEVQRILDSVETIDNVPQPNSQNAVRSGGVYGMIQQSKTEYDEVPVEGSSKAVRSGGLFNAFATKADAVPVVNHGTSDTTFALTAGVYHVWGDVSELNLTLAEDTSSYLYTYMFQFSSGAVPTSLTLPSTILGMDEIEIVSGMVYQVAITNNIARVVSAHLPTEVVSTPFLSRITANGLTLANDRALIRSLHGNTLVWNQIVTDSTTELTISGTTTLSSRSLELAIPINHQIYISAYVKKTTDFAAGGSEYNQSLVLKQGGSTYGGRLPYLTIAKDNAYHRVSGIVANANATNNSIGLYAGNHTAGDVSWKDVLVIDLTAMFGAGNEPTLAEFEALYPLGNYATDAGRLIDFKGETLVSKDTEENVLSTITINPTAMYGYLNGEGNAVKPFEDGMRSAGSVFDEVYKEDGKWYAKVNIGSVEITPANVTWSQLGTNRVYFHTFTAINSADYCKAVNSAANRVSDRMTILASNFMTALAEGAKGYVAINGNLIYITTADYNDRANLASFSINYELATPRTYLLTDEWQQILNSAYQVETGGMEIILPENGSEPYTSPACLGIEYTKNI